MVRFDRESAGNPEHSKRVDRLIERIRPLNSSQLDELERLVAQLEAHDAVPHAKIARSDISACQIDWPHAPLHCLSGKGTFIVTGTCGKKHFFGDADRWEFLQEEFLCKAKQYGWQIEAWGIFSNHYHFVGHAMEDADSLRRFLTHLHADTARETNKQDGVSDRQVWFNFWDTELTFEQSYFARLNYVHQNPVKHGLVPAANQYRWCSAAWFERTATPSQVKTIYSFKTDRVKVIDEFEVLAVE